MMFNYNEQSFIKNIKTKVAFGALLMALVLPVCPSFAAGNGCDKEDYDRINPEIALCSTHVYNIGKTQNQTTEANKQTMRDVVALKTTIITQQMQQQYDFLEATLKRLKTQLEKAVLTSKFEASGASSSSGSSSSNDKNVVLMGAENCLLKGSISDGVACVQNNVRIVLNAVNSGDIGDAYRQLQKDLTFAGNFGIVKTSTQDGKNVYKNVEDSELTDCTNLSAKRDVVNNCAYQLNVAIMLKQEADSKKNSLPGNYNIYGR